MSSLKLVNFSRWTFADFTLCDLGGGASQPPSEDALRKKKPVFLRTRP